MKNLIFVSLMLISFLVSNAGNDNKITPSDIKSVKIFTTGAVVVRTAKTAVDAGTTSLEFNNLSSSIDKQSVTVSGTGDVTILSVQYNLNYLTEAQKPREVTVLEDSLKYITHESAKLTNLQSVYDEELSMILTNKSIKDEREGVTGDKLTDVADFYRRRIADIKSKSLDIKEEQERLALAKNRINLQLNTLNINRNKPTGTIIVTLSSKVRTTVDLDISYLVTAAGWSPLYDIRAKDISSSIQLNYKANVHQNSGEDWKNVHITLSTGNPTVSGMMPILNPWHLNFYYPVYYKKSNTRNVNGKDLEQVVGGIPSAAGDKDQAGSYAIRGGRAEASKVAVDGYLNEATTLSDDVRVSQNQLSVDFDIAVPYSVPTDGKDNLVDVQHYDMKADYSYHAIPKLDKDAFLIAHVTGWESMNLLSGNANIFFENSFIGSSYLQLNNAKDTLEISLGRDKKISINREKDKDFSKTQTLGSNMVKSISYETTVRNSKSEAVNIIIDDQLPISDNKDITVKMIENSGGDYNEKTGIVSYKLNLAPSTTQKKKLSFSVKYPKDQNIPNL
ncbi:MAG: DUF4139 domain-containing protein [Bacteroidota bacterium]